MEQNNRRDRLREKPETFLEKHTKIKRRYGEEEKNYTGDKKWRDNTRT